MANQRLREQLARLSAKLELPADLVAGVPKLELTGSGELLLEQHRGIKSYSQEEVCIRVSLGLIRIAGSGLYIRLMNSKRIALCGTIHSITLEEGGA